MRPQSSVSGITANVRRYSRRFRDAGSRRSNRFNIVVNSIMRKSLRKSSLGLHKKRLRMPSEPITVSFFGFCSDDKTATSSSIDAIAATSDGNADHSDTVGTRFGCAAFRNVAGGSDGVSELCPGTMTIIAPSSSPSTSDASFGNSALKENVFGARRSAPLRGLECAHA